MPYLLDASFKGCTRQLLKPRSTMPIAGQPRELPLSEVLVELDRNLRPACRYQRNGVVLAVVVVVVAAVVLLIDPQCLKCSICSI